MATKGSSTSREKARKQAGNAGGGTQKKSPAAKNDNGASRPKKNTSAPVSAEKARKEKLPPGNPPVKEAPGNPKKQRFRKFEKTPEDRPANSSAENSGAEAQGPTIEEKLLILKRKMNREIFERCVEKHFFANISEWEELPMEDIEATDDEEVVEGEDID